jgi:hypothetical protein
MIRAVEFFEQNLAGWDKNPIRGRFAQGMKRRAKRGSNELARYPVISSSQQYLKKYLMISTSNSLQHE